MFRSIIRFLPTCLSYSSASLPTVQLPNTIGSHFLSSRSTHSDWTPPQRGSLMPLIDDNFEKFRSISKTTAKNRWLVVMDTHGLEFDTEQRLFDTYIKTLATVVGSEEEAKRLIYLVSCERWFGFGAETNEATKKKLEVLAGVKVVLEDYFYYARTKDAIVQSVVRFTPVNQNYRLNDIFSYYHLSERNSQFKSDHWLVHIMDSDDEGPEQQIIKFYIQLLAKVTGSEEEAKEKIYIAWCRAPLGFGAEIDREMAKKLEGLPSVLKVLPDYAFDVKHEDGTILVISSTGPSGENWEEEYRSLSLEDFHMSRLDRLQDPYTVSNNSVNCPDIVKTKCCDGSGWFITMEKSNCDFSSTQQMIDYFIRMLAIAIGSDEAKKKIYRIKCERHLIGFGADIDEETASRIKGIPGVAVVFPDYFFYKDREGNFLFADEHIAREMMMNLNQWQT